MSPEQDPTPPPSPVTPLPPQATGRRHIPNLASWIFGSLVVFVLIGIEMPVYNSVNVKGPQTKALAQAKQIGLALKLFAGDNDNSNFPRAGLPEMLGSEVKDSNAAFAVLFPQYLANETIFGNKLSAYQTHEPDNVIDNPYAGKPIRTLEPGENVYSYVAGLTDKSAPQAPLVVDGTDGTGHYTTDRAKRGGVWDGKKAIVVRVDNSAMVETLAGPGDARYIPRSTGDKGNLLDVSSLGPDVRLLDPAVGSH